MTSQLARYKAILAYDGTNYAGFQKQANARTVQGEVEAALQQIGWRQNSILAAGRTDSGVHAAGQVIAFELDWKHSLEKLLNALNALLPDEIAVQHIETTRGDFHPRFDAVSRSYRYTVFSHPVRNPIRERFAWRLWSEIDFALLQQAAALFLGTHDFRGFGTPPRPGEVTIRNVLESKWDQRPAMEYAYNIQANAFLYHMVRRIVRFQVEVAIGKRSLDSIELYLKIKQPDSIIGLAPPSGLTLLSVQYP